MGIQSGLHKVVAVIGCQKMTELGTAEILAEDGPVVGKPRIEQRACDRGRGVPLVGEETNLAVAANGVGKPGHRPPVDGQERRVVPRLAGLGEGPLERA